MSLVVLDNTTGMPRQTTGGAGQHNRQCPTRELQFNLYRRVAAGLQPHIKTYKSGSRINYFKFKEHEYE